MPNFGYAFYGFLSDYRLDEKHRLVDAPDGNAFYSTSVIKGAQSAGYDVHLMYPNRDQYAYDLLGHKAFRSFNQEFRHEAYKKSHFSVGTWDHSPWPELDILLLENRWSGVAGDWMQNLTLDHYVDTETKIVIWDLDHMVDIETDRFKFLRNVTPPFGNRTADWDEFTEWPKSPSVDLAYIGSRYDRDESLSRWLGHYVAQRPFTVSLYGNWMKYPEKFAEAQKRWPHFNYHGRAEIHEFRQIYSNAIAVPLLAKQSYYDEGFVTSRIAEAVFFGSCPIGFAEHKGIEHWLPPELICDTPDDLFDVVDRLRRRPEERVRFIFNLRWQLAMKLNAQRWFMEHICQG